MSERIGPETASLSYSDDATADGYQNLRSLLRVIVQDHFSAEELHTFHWKLGFPKKILEECTPEVQILRVLEERHFLLKWSKSPQELIEILKQTLHRYDLARMVQQWSERFQCSSVKPRVHAIQQETREPGEIYTNTGKISSGTSPFTPSVKTASDSEKIDLNWEHCQNLMRGHLDEEKDSNRIQIRSGPITDDSEILVTSSSAFAPEDKEELCCSCAALLMKRSSSHSFVLRTVSNASSGYVSDRSSNRFSELSLQSNVGHELMESQKAETLQERDFFMPSPIGGKSLHPKEAHKVSVEQKIEVSSFSCSARPDSPVAAKKFGVSSLERKAIPKDFEEPFRQRAGSLPDNAKSIREQVQSKVRNCLEAKSSTSLASDSSGTTSGSGDQSSTDGSNDAGSGHESGKANSLRRMQVVCSTRISTKISIPLKKIFDDIAKKKNMVRTSDPFPSSKDIQYQIRFFPSNYSNTACALYIDVAREYLDSQKKCTKSSSAVVVNIPPMYVTVTVSVHDSNPTHRSEILEKYFEEIPAKSSKLTNISDYLTKEKQKFVIVTSFPNLVGFKKLDKYHRSKQHSGVMIEVELDCCT